MLDPLQALRELVLNETTIMDLLDESSTEPPGGGDPATTIASADRVYRNRIPESDIEVAHTFHPPKSIVLRLAGGFGKKDSTAIDTPRLQVLCYGESDYEADRLRRAVWTRFVQLDREEFAEMLIHTINPASGALPLVDPDISWPGVSQTYEVRLTVEEAA